MYANSNSPAGAVLVGFGSSAAPQHRISSRAAIGCIAVVPQCFFKNPNLNVCFSRKRTLRLLENQSFQGQLSANSGLSGQSEQVGRRSEFFRRRVTYLCANFTSKLTALRGAGRSSSWPAIFIDSIRRRPGQDVFSEHRVAGSVEVIHCKLCVQPTSLIRISGCLISSCQVVLRVHSV